MLFETTLSAQADSKACNRVFTDIAGEVFYDKGKSPDHNYPLRLHGKTVHLMNGKGFNQSYALVDRPSIGDIVSIDRATDPDKLKTKKKWWDTSEIHSWEFCELKVTANAAHWPSPTINNWHVPVRVCLRHNGALQCANTWYADQS